MEGYRLTETEHNEVIWPELPVAQGEYAYPVDIAWRNIQLRNGAGARRAIARFAGLEGARYSETRCLDEPAVFDSFTVEQDCHVGFFRDGTDYRVQIFKDAAVRGGGFKIFRYYDEAPEPGTISELERAGSK